MLHIQPCDLGTDAEEKWYDFFPFSGGPINRLSSK